MTADLLRRAATKIRDTASTADPGPWASDGLDPNGNYYVHDVPDASPAGYSGVNVIAENAHEDNANHIALWSPNVALVIADWLDGSASDLEYGGTLSSCDAPGVVQYHIDFARLILGERP